jgi:hypothetical protein
MRRKSFNFFLSFHKNQKLSPKEEKNEDSPPLVVCNETIKKIYGK